jgi:uncharacterized integral membrane protein (TIGR00698 family)
VKNHSEEITQNVMRAWERNLLGVHASDIPRLLPGLLTAVLLAWLSIWLSDMIGTKWMGFEKSPVSAVMMAIVLGLVLGNVLRLPEGLKPGLTFSVKKVLRLGIILLGIRLSIFDVFKLGTLGIPIVLICILAALLFTTFISRRLRLPDRLGTLIAVGTSICGVSAIVATGPAIEAEDEEVAYAVAVITIFGILATLFYPYAANLIFSGDAVKVGFFLGTSVHDTSQVTGSALVFSDVFSLPRALDVATVTKLVRNVFMAAVIPLMTLYYTRRAAGEERKSTKITKLLPLFVLGFLILAVLRSIGDAGISVGGKAFGIWQADAWSGIYGFMKTWAVNLLVVALAGVGLSTRFQILRGLGIKPFLVGLVAALTVGLVSFTTISLLSTLIAF